MRTHTFCSLQSFDAELTAQASEPLYFVDYLREAPRDEATGEIIAARPSCYESVPGGMAEVRQRIEEFMTKFNAESKSVKMDLVLFKGGWGWKGCSLAHASAVHLLSWPAALPGRPAPGCVGALLCCSNSACLGPHTMPADPALPTDALDHVVRISRLLCMERGSALLVGVGGSGKQSLARLSASIAGAYTFQITITKTYGVSNLLEDIKGLYRIAGLKGQPVCFIFTDSDVKDEAFLEYINQVLMTGEIAGLFPKDELDVVINDMRPVLKAECPGEGKGLDDWGS